MTIFAMERLNFRLQDFTRHLWVSDHAKDVWQPRIRKILTCLQETERLAVAADLQPCMLRIVPPEQLEEQRHKMAEHGLSVALLDRLRVQRTTYNAVLVEANSGEPFNQRIVIGSACHVEAFQAAWKRDDQREVRSLLGYPDCCRDFFQEVWIKEKFIDTTWPMALNTTTIKAQSATACEVNGPPESNILLRWLGIRAVPHLPCSFACSATVARAHQLLLLGRNAGYVEEMNWLLAMLDWPIEWSALHGIAEIKTPVLKIAALSDATAKKYVVRRPGNTYPQEGAHGLTFPYRQPVHLRLTDSRSFQRGLAHTIQISRREQQQ